MYPGAHAARIPNKPAVIMAETGWTQTFGELDAAANRLSRLFRSVGLEPGDHVALCLENHPRFIEILFGCEYAGLIYTAASSRLTTDELTYIVNDCGARVFITSTYKAEQAAELLDTTPDVELRLMLDGVIDGYESYEDTVAQQSSDPLPERVAGTDMLYSSGTTGRPKGILPVLQREPLETRVTPVAGMLRALFGMDDTKTYLSPAPLYHAAPLRFSMSSLSLGATVVVMEHFDTERYLEYIERYRATHTQVVPTMFVRMLKLPDEVRQGYEVSSLECVIHAAAPCPVPVKKAMIEWWGPVIHEYYAGTEGQRLLLLQQRDVARPRRHGRACRSTARSTSSATTVRSWRRARSARSTSRAGARSSTTTIPRRRPDRDTHRGGRRSATSGTSMPTTTSTSPIARRT